MFATTDLTVGNPVRQIILFSLPMFIGGLIQQLYVAVDMVIVGRYCGLGTYSAVGATGSLLFFYFGTLFGLTGGAGVVTAQNYGANRMDRVRDGVRSCMRFLAGYGLFACAAALLFCGPITRLFLGSPPETVTNYVFRYLLVTTPFYIALSTILVYRNALQGLDYQFVPFAGGVLELIGRGAFAFPLLAWFGYEGVAATNILAWGSAALLDYLYYRKKVR